MSDRTKRWRIDVPAASGHNAVSGWAAAGWVAAGWVAAGCLFSLLACAPYQAPQRDAAVGTRLLGFDADGHLALLETFAANRADLVTERAAGGEVDRTILRGIDAAERARALADRRGVHAPPWREPSGRTADHVHWRTGGLQVEVRNVRPLGDRHRIAVEIRLADTAAPNSLVEIPVQRPQWPPELVLTPDRAYALIRIRLEQTDILAPIDLSRTRARLHHETGRKAQERGELAAAEHALEKAVHENPSIGDALYELAQVRALREDLESAAEALEEAFARFPRVYQRKAEKDDAFEALRARSDLARHLGLNTPSH